MNVISEPAVYKSPLHRMTQTTPTCLWNDSAAVKELTYSIEHGAVGATCNPVIVVEVLGKEMHLWRSRPRLYRTREGIPAIEEATYRGVSINATVCFTQPQCLAVAEAVERGLRRREREGLDISTMGPVSTIMVGRLDDWLRVVADRDDITIDPGYLEWARYNASDVEVKPRIDDPVNPKITGELCRKFAEFRRSYEENGLTVDEFDEYGATRRTLRQFLGGCHELEALIRSFQTPNPD